MTGRIKSSLRCGELGQRFHCPDVCSGGPLWSLMNTSPSQQLVGCILDRGQFDVPAVAAVSAAVGDDVAGEPQCVFARWGEEVAWAAAVDADDLFGRGTGEWIGDVGVGHEYRPVWLVLPEVLVRYSSLYRGVEVWRGVGQ